MTGKLTIPTATIAMVTSMLGGGVLFLPSSFRIFGYLYGVIVLLVCSISCVFTLYMIAFSSFVYRKNLLKCAVTQQENTDNEQNQTEKNLANSLGERDCATLQAQNSSGPQLPLNKNDPKETTVSLESQENDRNLTEKEVDESLSYYSVAKYHSSALAACVDACIVLQGLGSCVCYILTMSKWIVQLTGRPLTRFLLNALIMVPVYLLSIQKSLSSLKYASLLSVAAVAYLASLLLFYTFSLRNLRQIADQTVDSDDISSGLSTILFALGSHQNIVQVFSELNDKRMAVITTVSVLTYCLGPSLYLIIGFCGFFIAQGDAKDEIYSILLNSKSHIGAQIAQKTSDTFKIFPQIGAGLFLFVLLCAFPMQMHPTRNSIVNLLSIHNPIQKIAKKHSDRFKFIVTSTCCAIIYSISIYKNMNPDFVVGLIGATATVGITFVFPAIIYAKTIGKMNFKSISGIIVGLMGVLLSLYLVKNQVSK